MRHTPEARFLSARWQFNYENGWSKTHQPRHRQMIFKLLNGRASSSYLKAYFIPIKIKMKFSTERKTKAAKNRQRLLADSAE